MSNPTTPTATLTLAEFLLARLAEDEVAAREAGGDRWRVRDVEYGREAYHGLDVDNGHEAPLTTGGSTFAHAAYGVHIARHDPARVLADVEAKRRIIAEHPMVEALGWPSNGSACSLCDAEPDGGLYADRENPCVTLRALASIYADHPDYRQEWRP